MKIYSRRGDQGETDLFDGTRVAKDAPRIELCGVLDELNALLGVARAEPLGRGLDGVLARVQNELFDVGAEVACVEPGCRHTVGLDAQRVQAIEADIDRLDAELEPLRELIVPGGSRAAALLHHARTVCRRAERRLVALMRAEDRIAASVAPAYLNRLSDLLFVLARTANRDAGRPDVAWRKHGSVQG